MRLSKKCHSRPPDTEQKPISIRLCIRIREQWTCASCSCCHPLLYCVRGKTHTVYGTNECEVSSSKVITANDGTWMLTIIIFLLEPSLILLCIIYYFRLLLCFAKRMFSTCVRVCVLAYFSHLNINSFLWKLMLLPWMWMVCAMSVYACRYPKKRNQLKTPIFYSYKYSHVKCEKNTVIVFFLTR